MILKLGKPKKESIDDFKTRILKDIKDVEKVATGEFYLGQEAKDSLLITSGIKVVT